MSDDLDTTTDSSDTTDTDAATSPVAAAAVGPETDAPADQADSTGTSAAPRRRRAARRPVTSATPPATADVADDAAVEAHEASADAAPDDVEIAAAAVAEEDPAEVHAAASGEPPAASTAAAEPTESPETSESPERPRRRRASRPVTAAMFTHAEQPHASPVADHEDELPPAAAESAAAADASDAPTADAADAGDGGDGAPRRRRSRRAPAAPIFQPVDPELLAAAREATDAVAAEAADDEAVDDGDDGDEGEDGERSGPRRRRRGRRGRGRGRGGAGGESGDDGDQEAEDEDEDASEAATAGRAAAKATTARASTDAADADAADSAEGDDAGDDDAEGAANGTRRRRRRRRSGSAEGDDTSADDPPNTVTRVREPRQRGGGKADSDGVRGVSGSTRLEAKRQRRRDGRTGSRRAPIVTEAEYLARREAVERTMVVRNQGERTQIAVLEDGVLVEHYVTRASSTSYAGNVYLGKVQNVLPSMEAAFVDIGKGRNAVLYAGEVNYETAGLEGGRAHTIQEALKSGQTVLVQVTKDPIGQKGARLTSQVTLPGRYLVYVPEGSMTGISRKLPDTERSRLKAILKKIVPDDAGVIIRTAAEGASEEELQRDVERLHKQWEDIQAAAKKAEKHAPAVLHAEPDLVVRVVRDVFNEDFTSLVVQGDDEWQTIESYVATVAPDLLPRVSKWTGTADVFTTHRVDEQLVRALDRKVHLPSGGSLVIDRTEAMTVVDVNTGKFTGKGGNLEETVTRNNLEAAEEIVRQLRLRDVGGIIVIDFIDMVLESNRDLVLRRLTECLGRDRTRHQVAEVTSLGLVQMTRKRVGTGLIEAYSEPCLACQGRGVIIHMDGPSTKQQHTHLPANAPKPKFPVPKPPASLPADETGAEVAAAAEDAAVEAVVEGVGEHIDATESAPEPAGPSGTPAAAVEGETAEGETSEGQADADGSTDAEVVGEVVADAAETPAVDAVVEAVADEIDATESAPAPAKKAAPRRRRRATSGGPVSAESGAEPVS